MVRAQVQFTEEQAEALRLLGEYGCDDAALRERVLTCVVSLAGRDIARLTHFLECAREDSRNLILWHEHAGISLAHEAQD